ncbi:MAG: transporter substrate-binding domain-containing protein [Sulfurospirillaceae bacterium]|nr:transporter substrate-binding domain-containing protein [Sulfurospirillaceae bacterium]
MKSLKYILFILVFFSTLLSAFDISVTPKEQAWLDKNKTLRVRVVKNLPPFQIYKDGEYSGISVEYIKYFAKIFNLDITYVPKYTWAEALERIKTRDGFDVILKATTNEQRAQDMLFSKPYIAFPFSLLSNSAKPLDSFFDKPKTIALAKNYVINEKLKMDYPHFTYATYETNLDAMRAVDEGRADGYIGDIAIMSIMVKELGLKNVTISNFSRYAMEEQSVVTSKDWSEFISLFNKMLDAMPQELHVKIKRKYVPFLKEDTTFKPVQEIVLTDEEKSYISKNPTVTATNELDFYPYDFNENGVAMGYAVDYLKLLAQKIGLHVEFVSGAWSELYEKFKDRQIDIALAFVSSDERRERFLFSDKFMTMELSLVTRSKRDDIASLEDLRGKSVGALKDWASTGFLKEQYLDINVVEYATSKEMLEAVAFGLVDACVEDFFTANYIISKEMLANLRIVTKIELNQLKDKNFYLAFHKDNELLKSLFNKALKNVSKEEMDALKAKYLDALTTKEERLLFTMEEQLYLSSKKNISMCIDPDWMPFEMNDNGKHVGMVAEYIKLMEKFIGVPITLVDTSTRAESLSYVREKKCDILSLALETPKQKLFMNFTKPYMDMPLVLVGRLDKDFYHDIGSITNKPIGIAKDSEYADILKVRYPDIRLVEVKNEKEGLEQVQEGKIFATIGTLATVAYEIQNEFFGSLKIIGKFDEKLDFRVGIRSDEPLLRDIFSKAIDSIGKKESQEILDKWILVSYEGRPNYTYMYVILFFVFLVVLFLLYRQHELKLYSQKLEVLSNTDKLTGIYNRLKLDDILDYEKKLFDRFGRPLSVIMLDIDHFKKVNDTYGHKVGDDVLKAIARIIEEHKRDTDSFGRWGGEEFLLVCRETDVAGVRALAEKFRKVIQDYEFPKKLSITASFGVAEFEKGETIEKVFDKVDKALYQAKNSGRNRVV